MNMMQLIWSLSLIILSSTIMLSQEIKDTSYYNPLFGNVRVWENKEDKTQETIFHGGYIVKDNTDKIIVDGNKSGDCGCEPIENGFWVYYYHNGNIKEQGSFDCGEKVGTWIKFYENGSINNGSALN